MHNVNLPIGYSHVTVPNTDYLVDEPSKRDWINAYTGGRGRCGDDTGRRRRHVLWAADVWHSIKKHWCLEAQRLIRAQRASDESPAATSPPALDVTAVSAGPARQSRLAACCRFAPDSPLPDFVGRRHMLRVR